MDAPDELTRDRALVERIARELIAELGVAREKDDLLQSGFEGLLQAKARFDPDRAVPFAGFAYRRVRGAMLDMLRKNKRLPASTVERCQRAAKLEAALEQGAEEVAENPPAGDMAAADAISALLGKVAAAYVADLSASVERHGTEEGIVTQADVAKVRDAVEQIPDRLRAVVVAFFYEEQSLAEIGAAAGMSERWARWLLAEALDALRERLS